MEFSYTLVHHGCTFGVKYCEESNGGIVSSVSKASSVSIIYIKSYYSTVSNAQYCKNASKVSTGERWFPVRIAHSQYPNQVYKQSMECKSMFSVTNHVTYFWGLSNYFPKSVVDFYCCEVLLSSKSKAYKAAIAWVPFP